MQQEQDSGQNMALKTSVTAEGADILGVIQTAFARTKDTLEKKIQTLKQQLPAPPSLSSPVQALVYRHVSDVASVSFGAQSPQTIELLLHVQEKSKGFLKGTAKNAEFSIKVISRDHPVYESCMYEIPSNAGPLSSGVMEAILTTVEKAFFHQIRESHEQEVHFVRSVENFLGITGLANQYFARKYVQVCSEANLVAQAYVGSLTQTLEHLFSTLVEGAKVSVSTLDLEGLKEVVEARKSELEHALNEEAAEIRSWLEHEKQELKALKFSYEQKCVELDKRLEGHRQQVDAHAHEILPALEDIFPDVGTSSQNYTHRIDHDLRVFYAKLLQQDVQQTQGVSVNDALVLMRLLRDTCFPRNERPRATDLRAAYAGVRAVLQYVSEYAVDTQTVIDNIDNINKAFSYKGKGPKPTVEKLLEKTLAVDLDFSRYAKGLHSLDAKNKKDLHVL